MVKLLNESVHSFLTIHQRILEFERGRTSVHNIVSEEPSFTNSKRAIADNIGIPDERVLHTSHQE